MNSILVLDAGNALIKAKRGDGREDEFPHALYRVPQSEFRDIEARNADRVPEGYAVVSGVPYAYGKQAERYSPEKSHGAERYRDDYYGVFVALALARLFSKSADVSLFGSHAPGDVVYRDDLMRAAAHAWPVRIGDRELTFNVNYANTFDEPQGGLMNVILADDGQHYKHSDINGGRALVIDVGGKTTDYLAVNPGGEVDYSLHLSTQMGILDVIDQFERSFRANNKTLLKSIDELPADRVRDAIATGVFKGAGREYDCQAEVNEATETLIGMIRTAYRDKAGGPIPWDSIILTGGGSAMLYERLLSVLAHDHVLLADEPAKIHLANVRGGLKLYKLMDAEGWLE